MDTGLWTLRCQICREPFELELTGAQRLVEFARKHRCPNCHQTPDDAPDDHGFITWHRVVGFHCSKEFPRVQ